MALTKRQTGQPKIQVCLWPVKSPRLEGKTIKGIIGSLNEVGPTLLPLQHTLFDIN